MRKSLPLVLTALLALAGFGSSAQNLTGNAANWCGFSEAQEHYFATHPGAREAQEVREQQITALAQAQRRTNYATDVVIPVVVHIIHAGGVDNISDRQIASAIAQFNLDYQKLNADTTSIIPLFRPIAAPVGFEFRLAKKDPNGNCTTGITRRYAPNFVNDDRSGAVKALDRWDTSRYMNIWVVSTIASGGQPGTIIGYSSFPGGDPAFDGFVVRHDAFGNQGTAPPNSSSNHVSTHEIGHYFGLSHTWGNGIVATDCTGTDNVADTPPTSGTQSCNLNYAPCGPIANVQNFMDYSFCFNMFTQGQRDRMRANLTALRPNLSTAANLVATGTNDGYVAPNCAPIAAFVATSSANVCINTPVTFRDYSANFTAAGGTLSYSWSFPGGTPATATGQTVSVSYANAGFYSVTETVTNSVGSSTSTQTNIIRVEGPSGGETAPLNQSFEDPSFPALFASPTLRNYETNGTTAAGAASTAYVWRRQTAVPAADGSAYLNVTNRTYPASATTTLITPNINLAGTPNAMLRFARAYALRSTGDNTRLVVSFSSDCGETWSTIATLTGATLTTQGLTPIDGYAPASSAEWQTLSVAIPAQFQGSGLFKVRFQLVNGTSQGNTFFFDQLRITGPLAAKASAGAARGIAVFPNPLTRETAVHVDLDRAATVQVSLTDVLGRAVISLPARAYTAGAQTVALNPAGQPLQAGVYLVRVSLDGEVFTSKLTVE
ncbi:M43 family zinc metalloprotease [Hymenobacter mellowenesis]|nr:M43 family zinc metalloprotease [Hymenobacter sp. M29]